MPIEQWFRKELLEMTRDLLLDSRSAARGYFQPKAVARLIDEHASSSFSWHDQLWNLLMLEMWHRTFIDRRPAEAHAA